MVESKIDYYEKESGHFNPQKHFSARIQEMENKSKYGAKVASKWNEIANLSLRNEVYPVVHPIGQETFSLYAEFPTGVFEYALDVDGATSLIKEGGITPVIFDPSKIIASVDEGNINKDTSNIKINHKNPVMVLQSQYLTGGMNHCINGNHRIFEANRNNEKQIEVYQFKDLEFVPFFYDVLGKAMYYFEMDYSNVISNERNFLKDEYDAFAFIF
ncbi:hypothetical protein [Sporosarcina jiandibaonis]|uniref:hypothetical protein n=1 Tax=Sporosarcina jiandibaonis TaxID=2715535 RepID=UPI00155806E0|nr:hypothetical protein [Sporosarcina jiandibaonis]